MYSRLQILEQFVKLLVLNTAEGRDFVNDWSSYWD
jgi:hypothetical protein